MIRVSAKALICNQNRLLVIENQNPDLFYTLPGGGQNQGETLPEALRRECLEELRLPVHVHELAFVRDYIAAHHEFAHLHPEFHQVEMIFQCSLEPGVMPADGEHPDDLQTGFTWLPLQEIPGAPLYPRDMRQPIVDHFAGTRPQNIYLGDIN